MVPVWGRLSRPGFPDYEPGKTGLANLCLEGHTMLIVSKLVLVESVLPVNDSRLVNSVFRRRGMTAPVGGLLQAAEWLTCLGIFP